MNKYLIKKTFVLYTKNYSFSGTGSYVPAGVLELHLDNLSAPMHKPLKIPYLSTAVYVYSEHVGVNLQYLVFGNIFPNIP